MLNRLIILFILGLHHDLYSQKLANPEIGISLGMKNFGVSLGYKAFENLDILAGINYVKYNNLGFNAKARFYPMKTFQNRSFNKGSLYVGVGYENDFKSNYSKEDSRQFVNTFNIPQSSYIVSEIGYRYNWSARGETEYLKNNKRYFHLDMSAGITYRYLIKGASVSLRNGNDIDGELNRINNYLKSGFGFQIIFHCTIKKAIENRK